MSYEDQGGGYDRDAALHERQGRKGPPVSDIETNIFYAEGNKVYRLDADGPVWVASANPDIEGAAEQIVRALNRMPKAEAILIDVCAKIRTREAGPDDGDTAEIDACADAIEEWMVNG